ncbi:MAG: hypothetical protein ACR2LX_06950 [Jatrophihabitans sp.]
MGSDLIAETGGKEGIEGSGVVGDVAILSKDLFSDSQGWDVLIDEGLAALDVLSSAANPLGALISAGVGWLLEHIPGISDVWGKLMGDAAAIKQIAATWDNIAHSLNSSQTGYDSASGEIERWTGQAAESYRTVAQAYSTALAGASTEAEAMSIVVQLIGGICAALKDIVYTIISDFIEFTVLPAILGAIATAWCTFGGSIAVAITYIEVQADIAGEQITVKITKTTHEIVVVTERTVKVVGKVQKLEKALKDLSEQLEKNKTLQRKVREYALAGAHGQLDAGPATRGRVKAE